MDQGDLSLDEVDEDEPDLEDCWYNEEELFLKEDKPFDPCPNIPVSKEEFEEWCKLWNAALIVIVLGKRVNLGIVEHRLNRDWVKKGSAIGTILKIDRATSICSRGRFTRICVEIDLSKKLVPQISVLGSTLNIEYEGLHLICFSCVKYAHRLDQCVEASISAEVQQKTSADDVQATVEVDTSLTESEDHDINGATNRENDSRFDLLSEEDNENQHDSNVHEGVMSNMHGGLRINVSSQSNKGVQQSIQIIKKVPRPDAGKNAQDSSSLVGILEKESMEMVMLEYMRRFQKKQREAFEASKSCKHILDNFMVKNTFSPTSQTINPRRWIWWWVMMLQLWRPCKRNRLML
ncbi:hypothetical protein AHAS_Ahas11G0072200 [Arachis hypogaea]